MSIAATDDIKTYNMLEYFRRFTNVPTTHQQPNLATPGPFFIAATEQLYPLFTQPVPPSRAIGHSLVYLTSGQARMRIGNDHYMVGPHEMLITRAGQVYSFEPGDVNTGFVCHFYDDILLGQPGPASVLAPFAFLHFWGRPVIALPAQTAAFVEQLLRRLLAEYSTQQLAYPAVIRAYLLALLHELNRVYSTDPAPAPSTAALALTTQFKHLVSTSLKTSHRVSDYAAWLHISANHLSKCVRAVTGKSPARWIEESIVLEAKALLFQSTWPMSEVALAVGLEDASYFSRLFKKHTGLTPLAFRKQPNAS